MTLSYYFSLSKPNLKLLVTEIVCGIAGFTVEQIEPLFNKIYFHLQVFIKY